MVKLLAKLDDLDRKVIPKNLRAGNRSNERFIRLVLVVLGAANLVFGTERLLNHDLLSAGLSIVVGVIALACSRPFARWATEHETEDAVDRRG